MVFDASRPPGTGRLTEDEQVRLRSLEESTAALTVWEQGELRAMRIRADQGHEQRINAVLGKTKAKPTGNKGKAKKQPEVDLFGGGAA